MTQPRILVVDDEKGVVHSCVRILERKGFMVQGITDPQAVPLLLQQKSFDLLLTDIRMPKMDGLTLLQTVKEMDPHLTVILITGYGTMEDAIKAMRLGAQGFIMKPFEPDDLITTIKDNLKRRQLVRDSLRYQTLLPLLEINQILQISGGETSLAQRVLELAHQQTRAARLVWLSNPEFGRSPLKSLTAKPEVIEAPFVEMMVVPETAKESSKLPPEAIQRVVAQARPLWISTEGVLLETLAGQSNIIGAIHPMIIKGKVSGVLMAETGEQGRHGPFDQMSLDLISFLAGQLAIIIENVQLFQQTKALHTFNEDIIQAMTNGLIAINQQGHITTLNAAAAVMLGQEVDQVLHTSIEEALSGAEALVKILRQTLESGQVQSYKEITVQHWDGNHLPLAVSASCLTDSDTPEPVGVVAVLEDLSERKAFETERRRLDRLAALGEMSAVVAHEIRNPIAGIAAGVEYITGKVSGDSPDAEGAAMIQSEITRVNRIIEDILFVARPLPLNTSLENLSDIIDDVIQRCQPQIMASLLQIKTDHNPDLPLIEVDRQRLEQVFRNLIINATQAMYNEQLTLQTKFIPAGHGNVGGTVRIIIEDTGPGIPAEAQRRIFEPFFTTKTRGTGLGLAVARRIVEAHGGTINIDSLTQKGTRFLITLPLIMNKTTIGSREVVRS